MDDESVEEEEHQADMGGEAEHREEEFLPNVRGVRPQVKLDSNQIWTCAKTQS